LVFTVVPPRYRLGKFPELRSPCNLLQMDKCGHRRRSGGDVVSVVLEGAVTLTEGAGVTDHGDGTYSAVLRDTTISRGYHQLQVKVADTPFK
jgi:hypothetical protein